MLSCHKSSRWIILEGVIKEQNWECIIGILYRGYEREDRLAIYEDLIQLKSQISIPFLIMGGFNEVLYIEERKGQKRIDGNMREFRRWIDDCNLLDIPLKTKNYTWRRGKSMSKLDRFLCDREWLLKFP